MRATGSEGSHSSDGEPVRLGLGLKPSGSTDLDANEPTEVVRDPPTSGTEVALPVLAPKKEQWTPLGLGENGVAVFDDENDTVVIEDGAFRSTLEAATSEDASPPPVVVDSGVHRKRPRPGYALVKRALDLLFVACSAPLWVPLYGVISMLILIFDGRPIHYMERRVGRAGRAFTCVKFRSMHRQAGAGASAGGSHEATRFVKTPEDPRRTRLGRALRRVSLDELPQLLNVLAGHMSLVGPRPVTSGEVARYYGPNAQLILSIRPGLSGLWQISGRSLLSVEARTRLELQYVLEQGLWTDVSILAKTVPAVIRGHGAF